MEDEHRIEPVTSDDTDMHSYEQQRCGMACRGRPVLIQLIVPLLLALSASCSAAGERCSVNSESDVRLSVTSHRNETGHWTLTVDALTAKPDADSSPRGVAVDVSHGSASCESAQYTRLSTTAVYESPTPDVGTTTQIPTTVSEVKPHRASSTAATPGITTIQIPITVPEEKPPTSSSTAATRAPPAGYEYRGGLGHYKFHATALTWEEARDRCVSEGGHLLVINSEQEAAVVAEMWKENRRNIKGASFHDEVYVGVSDIAQEGRWESVLGGLLGDTGYVRWMSGEPNGGRWQNCLTVDANDGVVLSDMRCTQSYAFICEWHFQHEIQ